MAFRKWLATAAGGGPQYAGAGAPEAWRNGLGQLRRRELLDRYSQHTHNCASCRKVAGPPLLQPAVFPCPAHGLFGCSRQVSCAGHAFNAVLQAPFSRPFCTRRQSGSQGPSCAAAFILQQHFSRV